MNPSIEVQINARLDQLDAGLKVAEAKINESASKMGNAGDKAGSAFVNKMVGNMVKGLAMGAVTNILGSGILNAVKGINAGDSGEKIGMDVAKGIVDGAKSIPIAGVIVSILDEIVNGFDRVVDAAQAKAGDAYVAFLTTAKDAQEKVVSINDKIAKSIRSLKVGDDPTGKVNLQATERKESTERDLKAVEAEQKRVRDEFEKTAKEKYNAAKLASENNEIEFSRTVLPESLGGMSFDDQVAEGEKILTDATASIASERSAMERQLQEELKKYKELAAEEAVAIERDAQEKIKEINEKAAKDATALTEKAVAEQEKAAEVEVKRLQKLYDEHVAETIAEEKRVQEEKLQAQQDIIDAEQAAQAQISKVGRVDQMAGEAARGMINSGQTALGQFNFAQEGAAGQAMTLAQKQVASLEKIEAATAEMVRLEKEGGGFR